jgi:hypothetical protein
MRRYTRKSIRSSVIDGSANCFPESVLSQLTLSKRRFRARRADAGFETQRCVRSSFCEVDLFDF